MPLPRIVVTGASGFVGRHLLAEIKEEWQVFGLGRRSQHSSGAPVHPNISWWQVDIGDREPLGRVFSEIAAAGGADVLLHLAAHYDFTGHEHPEYMRTNVHGLRNVLDLASTLGIRRFILASSVAASKLPAHGSVLTEASRPDGDHIYARTKRIGEEMLAEYRAAFGSCIVRFAALFSDWCEYPPLFMFVETWLSGAWNARILGGSGRTSIPYMHVRDATSFLGRVLARRDELEPGEILIASPNGSVSHQQLFEATTLIETGSRRRPLFVPKVLCGPGMWAREVIGKVLGDPPFERPWMARYIDTEMNVVSDWTRQRLGWEPRARLDILRRLAFLLENRRAEPGVWLSRNRAAMKRVRVRPYLLIHRLLEDHEDEIRQRLTARVTASELSTHLPNYRRLAPTEHAWHQRLILRSLASAVRTRDKGVFTTYCRDLARRRRSQGFAASEVAFALEALNAICLDVVAGDPRGHELDPMLLKDHLTMTIQFGIDHILDVYEELGGDPHPQHPPREAEAWRFRRRPHHP